MKQRPLNFDEFLACYGSDKRYELIDGEYDIQLLRGDLPITSLTFPDLNLTAAEILSAGQ
ncbi:MAG: hypothetical protein J7529_23210 [Roseofilum sp. Guam]|nr:hypothetical protein [Roseofilum sp. Guam]